MPMMKGGELIAETLVQEKVPYIFGICGHGNVGILDALYDVRDQIKLDLAAPRAVRRPHGRRLLPRQAPPGGHAHVDRPGLGQPRDVAGHRAVGLVGLHGHHRPTCRPRSTTARRSRSSTSTTRPTSRRCCARSSSAPSSPRAWTCCRWRCARRLDTMVTGRPGPVNLDIPYNVYPGSGRRRAAGALATSTARTVPARSDADVAAALDLLAAAQQAGALHRPGRDAVRGRARDRRVRAPPGHPGHHLAQRHGLHPRRRSAGARLHRPQRRVPGQPGGTARGPRRSRSARASTTGRRRAGTPATRGTSRRRS